MTPITNPNIKRLEESRRQLTQPSVRPADCSTILLEDEEQCAEAQGKREGRSSQVTSRNDELALALEVLNLVFRKLKSSKRNLGKQPANGSRSTLPPEVLHQVGKAIWAHWNAPCPTISYKIKNALKNLFEYINNSRLDFAQSSTVQFFLESVKQSILLEKRSLSILSYLLPHLALEEALPAFRLYAAGPAEFLGTILGAIGDDKLASGIGQLAVHWTTKVEGWDSKEPEVATKIGSDWISSVFSILFSSEERKRQYLCQYYLLPLFKRRPQCSTELAERLSSTSGPRFGELGIANSPFDYLSGIIALARLNPRQSCTRDNPSPNGRDLPEPWLPDTLLKVSLSHPAVSLRSSALAIICQSSTPAARLPLPHLDLVLQFFAWNFGEVEAELKQNIFSHLTVFFARLRDSSNSTKKNLTQLIHKKSNLNQSNRASLIEETSANDLEASRLQSIISESETYLGAVQAFILRFVKLCRSNLTISSPYRCQMASLTYLQILLNTGIDPLYLPGSASLSRQDARTQSSFPFDIRIIDQSLIHKLILALTSTYVDVREASFTLLQHCHALDSQFGGSSALMQHVVSYALQCVNSRRESENCTATLLFRLILEKAIVRNAQVPSALLPRNSDRHIGTKNPLAIFLLGRLDDMGDRVLASETNLGKACEDQPIAGSIMLISELFKSLSRDMIVSLVASNDLKDIMEQTRKLVLRVWRLSAVVLCHSSDRQSDLVPDHEEARAVEFISAEDDGTLLEDEGVLPDRSLGNRHKTILSACWRSMKEASALLMQTAKLSLVAEEQSVGERRGTFLSYQDLEEIGQLFEQWLLEIRHRGAFGAIHASYSSLCDALCSLPRESSQLPLLWLQAHISAITSRKMSTTRRSAGLPYCILSACQALARSSPSALKDCLSRILSLAESHGISSEVQVHILNTLKILLTDGKVSAHFSAAFIERSFGLAITSFVSLDWKVRNGALILFSGLTNRVFGTRSLTLDRSHANLCKRESLSDFSRRLPTMPAILVDELRRSTQAGIHLVSTSHSHGPIFAVLTLLALLQNPDCAPASNQFLPLVRECLSSKVSKVRSIGADAMTGLIPCSHISALLCDLLTEAAKSRCHNEVHGLLLLVSRLVQVPSALLEDEKSKIQAALAASAPVLLHSTATPLVSQSSFLGILEIIEARFGITVDPNCLFSCDSMMGKVQELRRVRAPALNSYEIQATRNILRRDQGRETVLRLLEMGSTPTRITVFRFLENEENRAMLNDPEIIEIISLFGRQSTHSISVRLPALKLLALGSHGGAAAWPLKDLFGDYQASLAVPMRDSLRVLAGSFMLNPLAGRGSDGDDLPSVHTWAMTILDEIEGAAHEDQSTETRLSAVEGLTSFLHLFKMDNGVLSMTIKLRVLELLITLIQDDDDEIRASLTKTLDQTKFLSNGQLCEEEGDVFELEMVPNLILEKLVRLAITLDPLFGFKKLLKIDDFQADLDQLFKPSDDLFVTERLNLYKDDFLELGLVQRISLEILLDSDRVRSPEGEAEENQGIAEVFRDTDLRQEIEMFKHLMGVVIPTWLTNTKGADVADEHTVFKNVLPDTEDGRFNVISYQAWFSLVLRLSSVITIFTSFPAPLQRVVLARMLDIQPPHDPSSPILALARKEVDDRSGFIEHFLSAHYY